MILGEPDGYGRYGILGTDAQGRIVCHECGQAFHFLVAHLWPTHEMRAAEYRAAHGLAHTQGLVSEQESARRAAASDTDEHRDRLREYGPTARAAIRSRQSAPRAQSQDGWAQAPRRCRTSSTRACPGGP